MEGLSNSYLTLTLHRSFGGEVTVDTEVLSTLILAFCNLTEELGKPGTGKSKEKPFRLSLSIVSAHQGSLVIKLKAAVSWVHEHRNDMSAYASILSLPVALFALAGVGQANQPTPPDDEYRTVLREMRTKLRDKEVERCLDTFLRQVQRLQCDELIIVAPGAPSTTIRAIIAQPTEGHNNQLFWEVEEYCANRAASAIKRIPGVDYAHVRYSDDVFFFWATIEVQLSSDLDVQAVHRARDQISGAIRSARYFETT